MRSFVPEVLALSIAAAVVAGAVWAAEAERPVALVQGDQLREGCQGPGLERGVCQGYVGAVVDLERLHSRLAEREPLYCIPEGLALDELSEHVSRWLASHPEQAERAAVAQVTVALIASFPCSNPLPAAADPAPR